MRDKRARRWAVRFADLPNDKYGDTSYSAGEVRFGIKLIDMELAIQLDTLIHELLHVQFPFLGEHDVEQAATEMTRVIMDQFTVTERDQ